MTSKQQKERETFCNQLQILTGEPDKFFLHKAYIACNGDLPSAITYIEVYKQEFTKDTAMPDLTGRSLHHHRASSLPPTSTNIKDTTSAMTGVYTPAMNCNPFIDLTEDDPDLQQAIRLSMECNAPQSTIPSGNSMDTDSSAGASNYNTSTDADKRANPPSNPYLRRRAQDWPAGLKNIGNTCWFNSVVQSLFHLPVFRNLVLQYKPPSELPPVDSERHRNICFLRELKNLFALLVGTNQSYLDPTKCVAKVLSAFARDHQQQDVGEFTHKLLDWLEDAMTLKPSESAVNEKDQPSSSMDIDNCGQESIDSGNPMIDLFYGKCKAEGVSNGNSFTKPQRFGIFPVYVNGIDNLHDSLDYTTRDRSNRECASEMKDVVGQEHWFTKLPPVMIFELSRFHYNPKSGEPEKIHSRFDFPHLLYMDRYMESNAERIRQCRVDSDALTVELHEVKEELKKRRKIMVGEKSCSIQDVLLSCTEIAASKRKRYLQCKRSHDLPKRTRSSSGDHTSHDMGAGDGQAEDNTEKKIESASLVEECLKTWLDEFEREKEALRDDMNNIRKRLDSMYDDPALKQHPYDLHAVLIHQGSAGAGHYWAYIKNHKSRWLRYNDIEVRETDWDELIRESVGGGQGITSAYCLMYIDRRKKSFLMAAGAEKIDTVLLQDEELQAIIDKHNADYSNELEEWDVEQAKMLSLSYAAERDSKTDPHQKRRKDSEVSVAGSTSSSDTKKKNEASTSWNAKASMNAIESAQELYETLGPEETLEHVLNEEFKRLRQLEKESSNTSDVRLHHVAVYMFRNSAPRKVIERTLLEQFSDDRMTYDHRASEIMNCAKDKLRTLSPEDMNEEIYQKWHRDYRLFCQATCHLLQGLEYWSRGQYKEALPHLANVKRNNEMLSDAAENESSNGRLADWDLGLKTVEQCLELLNKKALDKVENDSNDSVNDGIAILIDDIVPWIHLLPAADSEIETPLMKTIHSDWCNLDISAGNLHEKYKGALAALMDPPSTFRPPTLTKPQNAQDLCDRFQKVMSKITQKC